MEPWTRVDQAAEDARAGRTTGDWHSPEKVAYRRKKRLEWIRHVLGPASEAYECQHLGEVITCSVGDGSSTTAFLWRRCTIDLERRNCTGRCTRYVMGTNPSTRYVEKDEASPEELDEQRRLSAGWALGTIGIVGLLIFLGRLV